MRKEKGESACAVENQLGIIPQVVKACSCLFLPVIAY